MRAHTSREIAEEIWRGLHCLAGPTSSLPERHRSMAAAFAHSWRLLAASERQALGKLSFFRGGIQREAAQAVAAATLPLLSALVDKSMMRRAEAGRYDLHELVRQYAASRLQTEADEADETAALHAGYYLELLQSRQSDLQGAQQKVALAELSAEIDNLRAAWGWAVAHLPPTGLRPAIAPLWYFYNLRCYLCEGEILMDQAARRLAETFAEQPETEPVVVELRLHQAYFATRLWRHDDAAALLRDGIDRLRRLPELRLLAHALRNYGTLCWIVGQYAEARASLDESLTLLPAQEVSWQRAFAIGTLGGILHDQGLYAEAYARLAEAVAVARQVGGSRLLSFALATLARTAIAIGRTAGLEDALREGMRLAAETGDQLGVGLIQVWLALAAQARGDSIEAGRLYEASTALLREIGDPWGLARAILLKGHFHLERGETALARGCFEQALDLARSARATAFALDALLGFAAVAARDGRHGEALTLAQAVERHPASAHPAKALAEQLRADLEERLTLEQVEAIRARAASLTLEMLAQQVQAKWP